MVYYKTYHDDGLRITYEKELIDEIYDSLDSFQERVNELCDSNGLKLTLDL